MESPPTLKPEPPPQPHTLSPSSSGRRSSTDTNSPEFEFWMLRNPSFPQPHLLSADELFVDGVLLPLQLVHTHQPEPTPQPDLTPEPESIQPEQQKPVSEQLVPEAESEPGPEISSGPGITLSKRWKDIFKKSEKKNGEERDIEKEKKKSERERKGNNSSSGSGSGSAELNINIWPFSRSKSAGNNNGRQRVTGTSAANRKVSSAPCSRSNSAGESKSRKWPSSPGRVGVHLGRSSPVWQVRRGSGVRVSEPVVRSAEKGLKKEGLEPRRSKVGAAGTSRGSSGFGGGGARARVMNLNVPMCIGYRPHLSCRTDENSAIGGGAVGGGSGGGGGGGGNGGQKGGGANVSGGSNLFNLRSLFTKKVY